MVGVIRLLCFGQAAFANAWDALIKRVQKHVKGFRKLPFGTLRDTVPDMLRHTHSDELASLAVSHGSPTKSDKLLDCYGDKPHGRLHEASGNFVGRLAKS